jgi:hypothetical protein
MPLALLGTTHTRIEPKPAITDTEYRGITPADAARQAVKAPRLGLGYHNVNGVTVHDDIPTIPKMAQHPAHQAESGCAQNARDHAT